MSTRTSASNLSRYVVGFALLTFISAPCQARFQDKNPELQQNVSKILNNRSLRGADVGVVVKSLKTNKIIYEKNPNLLLNPASNVKLVTTLAALHILKPEYRFKTDYLSDGFNLAVKGYGDPSVTTERLRSVARQLRLRGITQVAGDLILDESFFDGQRYAKGHDREKNNVKAWAAPTSALSLNRNVFEVFIRPVSAGSPAFTSMEPQSDYFRTVGTIKTTAKGFSPRISLGSESERMTVQLSGVIGQKTGARSFYRRVTNPTAYFGHTFRSILENEGIAVRGQVRSGFVSPQAKSVFVDRSPRLADLVNETNKQSSNFLAEMLVKAIAGTVSVPATFDSGLAQIEKFLEQKVGLKRGSFVLGNGSGLNQANEFSAAQLVKVLDFATRDFELASEFISSLSVAGTQGTLSRRLKDPMMLRQLRAKTGTLSGVSSLTGYMAGEKDDMLLFAIMFDGHRSSAYQMTAIQDEISRKLAKNVMIVDHENVDLPNNIEYEGDDNSDDELDNVASGG